MTGKGKSGMLIAAAAACLILTVESGNNVRGEAAVPDSADIYRLGGIAQYDEDNFESAVGEYRNVVRLDPTRSSDHLNLGLALMESNDLEGALTEFQEALRLDDRYTHIYYSLGICLKRLGRYQQASQWLAEAALKDSSEVAAWYNLGICYRRIEEIEKAKWAFTKVVDLNYYNVNAHYNLMRIAQSEKDSEILEKERAIFRELKAAEPPSDLPRRLEICKYSYMIDLKDTLPSVGPYTSFGRSVPVTFVESSSEFNLPKKSGRETSFDTISDANPAGLTAIDIDRDGWLDILVYGPVADQLDIAGLYRSNGGKGFGSPGSGLWDPPLKGVTGCIAADYDNDGDTDIYCLKNGPNLLYRNSGGGRFVEVADASGVAGAEGSVSAVFQDHDNDGDLDLLVVEGADPDGSNSGRLLLYRNNSDGTFAETSAQMELTIPEGGAESVAAVDFDNDNDSDILLLGRNRSRLFSNRLWAPYEEIGERAGLAFPGSGALIVDCNGDGFMDLLIEAANEARLVLMVNDGRGKFSQWNEWKLRDDVTGRIAFSGCDYDNDGFGDLVVGDGSGLRLLRGGPDGAFTEVNLETGLTGDGPVLALAAVDADGDRDDDIVTIGPTGISLYRNEGGNANNSILVNLRGQKNNHDGIGSRVEVKAGRFYQKQEVSGPYLRFGIGSLKRVDVVRVWWANNVIQNARDVEADSTLEVLEKPGMLGSCPYVYVFGGGTYRFISDALVTSTMGFYLAPDVWFPPDGDEYVIIPGRTVDDRDGTVRFGITEELREVTYIDQLKLFHVDIPRGRRLISNEIFRTSQPEVKFYTMPQGQASNVIVHADGRDITETVRHADGSAYKGKMSNYYDGMTEPQSIVLDLNTVLDLDDLYMIVNGWVDWTNSSINRAIWQDPTINFTPPYLEALTASGKWETVLPELGFHPGWYKTTLIDLSGLIPQDSKAIRIKTNMAINWDEIGLYSGLPQSLSVGVASPPSSAELRWRGYSRVEHSNEGRPIDFIWSDPLQDAGWPLSEGLFTRYGDSLELIKGEDKSYAIINHGDALMAEFPAAGPVPPGRDRYYLLYLAGWCKDGDPNTLYSQTVEPMPGHESAIPSIGRIAQPSGPGGSVRTRLLRTPSVWEAFVPR